MSCKAYVLPISYSEIDSYRNAMYFDEGGFLYLLKEIMQSVFDGDCRPYLETVSELVDNYELYKTESQDIQDTADNLYNIIYPHLASFNTVRTKITTYVHNLAIRGNKVFIEVSELYNSL